MKHQYDCPIVMPYGRVLSEWIDYNRHMNVAYYVLAFDHTVDAMLEMFEIGFDYMERHGASQFVLENHITYLRELSEGDSLRITLQLLDYDTKRLHYFMAMYHAEQGYLAATSEQISMHVSLDDRRAAPLPEFLTSHLEQIMLSHSQAPRPEQVGNIIGIRRKAKPD